MPTTARVCLPPFNPPTNKTRHSHYIHNNRNFDWPRFCLYVCFPQELGKLLLISDLDKIIYGYDCLIAAGNLNANHSFGNSHCANVVWNTLYHLTIHQSIPGHIPDVLGIAFTKLLSQTIGITNLNELISDHDPFFLNITDLPISSTPPLTNRHTKCKKFSEELVKKFQSPLFQITTTQ